MTPLAQYLRSWHVRNLVIDQLDQLALVDHVPEAGPTGARVELCAAVEEWCAATSALVRALLLIVPVGTGEGSLRALSPAHLILEWRKLLSPFVIRFFNLWLWEFHVGCCCVCCRVVCSLAVVDHVVMEVACLISFLVDDYAVCPGNFVCRDKVRWLFEVNVEDGNTWITVVEQLRNMAMGVVALTPVLLLLLE